MTQQKKASRRTERIRKRRTYLMEGNHGCRSAILFILCWSQYQLLKELSNPPPRQLPEPLSPPGLSPERSKYLFQNKRQFVREDCQDILCPAVPE
ncbi:hypothetical protein PoB_004583500 [Plakobranchus ocellatus]|uniref:Uncharacterized protein n=1 Tax=Plakobranchus ocellatus TaxID=259542 RepID=A0AAV4BFK1_9GAST|nr:hypothetical protein PoB_004583500 [Plakobranchus ocellatus]